MRSILDEILKNKSVFILGAGASHPYGFPLGESLKANILAYPDKDMREILKENQALVNLIPEFKDTLRFGSYDTIDEFLERKKRFRELGAYYIVKVISKCEIRETLWPQKDLYYDIFSVLKLESEIETIPPITVVTLNYDRSLEYFLSNNVKYNCSDDYEAHAQTKLSQLQVFHPHGSLGDLSVVPYGHISNSDSFLYNAVGKIKIVSDNFDNSKEFQIAQQVIAEAQNIIFLGFGYHTRTLNALLPKSKLDKKHLYGTTYRLGDERRTRMNQFAKDAKIKIFGQENEDSSTFLKRLQMEAIQPRYS